MARPVGFEGANKILQAPPGDDNCRDLECFSDGESTVSCWRLSKDEMAEIARTGVVWFMAVGQTHPPIHLSGTALVKFDGRASRAEPELPFVKSLDAASTTK